MRAIVTNKYFEWYLLDGKCTLELLSDDNTVNVYYDEDMYINPNSDFSQEMQFIAEKSIDTVLNMTMLRHLEYTINNLINEYRNRGELFLHSEPRNRKNNFIVLRKYEYFTEMEKCILNMR